MRAVLVFALLAGCAVDHEVEDGDSDIVLDDPDAPDGEGKADGVWYTPITKEYFLPTAKVASETRKLFKSEAEWVAYFGQPSPGIDFSTRWAIFYTPGVLRDDLSHEPGWRARLARVWLSSTGKTLMITTRLERNGESCPARSTRPFITATIPQQTTIYKRFYRSDVTRDCD